MYLKFQIPKEKEKQLKAVITFVSYEIPEVTSTTQSMLPHMIPFLKKQHSEFTFCSEESEKFCNTQYIAMEKAMTTHSSTLAWKIQWTEGPGGLQSMGSLGVGHD